MLRSFIKISQLILKEMQGVQSGKFEYIYWSLMGQSNPLNLDTDELQKVSLLKGGWGFGCIKRVEFRENERAFCP